MKKLVTLSLGGGNLQDGFPHIQVQIREPDKPEPMQRIGSLPAASQISDFYTRWHVAYLAMHQDKDSPRVKIKGSGFNNISEIDFDDLCQSLKDRINAWLNSESFRNIYNQLRSSLSSDDEIEFIIETDNSILRRLPWHLWNFFDDYPNAEVALSTPEYHWAEKKITSYSKTKVRILAVFGDEEGIDIKKDRDLLNRLSGQAEIEFLSEPEPKELYEKIERGWDIFFFAGHSNSTKKGIIQINKQDSLSLDQLSNSLKKAISKGLKLAIFNSCDGLGLAEALACLHIPQVIVMRYPVSDVVAQEFLKTFLKCFSSGQSLYSSVHEARESLQKLQAKYPCATWLPVIWQNPSEKTITWQELRGQQNQQGLFGRRWLQIILLLSVGTTALVMGTRYLGFLQGWELQSFDQLMRSRQTNEALDPRITVITVTEEDLKLPVQQQANRKGSLSDLALDLVLRKIAEFEQEKARPRVIGLDIYHDFPVADPQEDLAARMGRGNFVAVCKYRDSAANHPGVAAPSPVTTQRQGFSDLVTDPDGIVRRHLLMMRAEEASPCTTTFAFSTLVAFRYLAGENQRIMPRYNSSGELQLGATTFHPLHSHIGGYQGADVGLSAYQIMLNYRSTQSTSKKYIAKAVRQFTLAEVLDGKLTKDAVKDRIVLIGTSAQTFHDYISTPYVDSDGFKQEIPGVIVQAQMVSQILSAVLNNRSLLWIPPFWGEVSYVLIWSFVGGMLAWRLRSPLTLAVFITASGACLYFVCLQALSLSGCWLPLVPSGLALAGTSGTVVACRLRP